MSTDETVGQRAEQQPEPTSAAGGKDEVSRNVQGTVDSTGLADIRARVKRMRNEATQWAIRYEKINDMEKAYEYHTEARAFERVRRLIDERIGCQG